ncbi:hypothetical protein ANN_04149 [Periplaneta americana]|uniref:Uncharacterized protein n=1 Tax=Periplaneta americana TaxID=6978 RepID=A0ABQ8T9S9_PERAM|nr:hypothetical protein ANN_04149 [Periplaneta americana]
MIEWINGCTGEKIIGWMDGWVSEWGWGGWMDGRMNNWISEKMDGCICEKMIEWMDRCIGEKTVGWMDGWMDGLRVFENKVLRKMFGAKRDEVTGEWRKLHNTELHALYSSPDIIRNLKSRRLRWAGHVARMGESRNAYRVLVGKPEGKRPLGRPRRRWEDNIKMDLREVGTCDRRGPFKHPSGANPLPTSVCFVPSTSSGLTPEAFGSREGTAVNAAMPFSKPQNKENGESYTTESCTLSPDIIRNIKSRRLRWARYVARMEESRNAYRVLVGRPEGKRPLGRPRRRWEDNIKMNLREVGYDGRDWINLAQDRDQWRPYVRAPMNLWVP